MKTKVFSTIYSLMALSLLFTSCSDEKGDTTKPVIELHAPTEGAILKVGSSIHFDMDLSDNEMLASYRVEIHGADGHDHQTKASGSIMDKSWDISGHRNIHIHHHDIQIPADVPHGDYHFMVYCLDAAGNMTYVVRNITLSDEGDDGHHS